MKLALSYREYLLPAFDDFINLIDAFEFFGNPGTIDIEHPKLLSSGKDILVHSDYFSVGSDTINYEESFLSKLNDFILKNNVKYLSEHFNFCRVSNISFVDNYIPIFASGEYNVNNIVQNINSIKDYLKIDDFLLENISAVIGSKELIFKDARYLQEVCLSTSSKILLDLNNVYVNSLNYDFDPLEYISLFDKNLIRQVHLAGFSKFKGRIIDSHSNAMDEKVVLLLDYLIRNNYNLDYVILEYENFRPNFDILINDLKRIRKCLLM